ncbi:NAD(P)/FAD-dependent oxidoreductase [Dongia deserti]|uniref:NAD(P)/FAD-dependent oxidoreductase n=1 Tax=Dongia deserti TaxID=2268030 RepID=UPI000E655E03|nr:FAD-binding oxidoreductase [Dongia deserti]
MDTLEHPQSYYVATARPFPHLPELRGEAMADVAVIGGGYTGLSAALNLAERGYNVVLIEQARIGWGASGRNGGQINTGLRKGPIELMARYGRDRAKAMFSLAEEGRSIIRERVARHRIRCDLKANTLLVAHRPKEEGWMRAEVETLRREFGYTKARFVPREELDEYIGSDAFHAGIADWGGGHLHPLNYALGLAQAAIDAGAQLYERTRAVALNEAQGGVVVSTGNGQIKAAYAVIACDAYLGDLEPRIATRIMPIANFLIATEPLSEEEARALIPGDSCVCDSRFVVNYFRLSGDRRMIWGGGEKYTPTPPPDIAAFVRPHMARVFPQLADKKIEYAWSGMVGITMSRLPNLGRIGNIFYAQGYSGQGVAITGIAGKLIAEALSGTAERFDVFANLPHRPFPGGTALRHPLMTLAMLWYAMRDRL